MKKGKETPSSIYLMHKYWGKKPSNELKEQVLKYTKKNDTIFDPFAGYGGIGIEAIIEGRNVILNDLNPSANYIAKCILEKNVDLKKLEIMYHQIMGKCKEMNDKWYTYNGSEIITLLRNKEDRILKLRIKDSNNKYEEIEVSNKECKKMLDAENNYKINTWYPNDTLIQNSRIGSNGKLRVCDLFPKRALICQSFLYDQLLKLEDSSEKNMLILAFTSNLANCSKLVPPISSRGDMAQGAWMTGFYIGNTYLENNVFHYYENRVKKIIKGKKDYLILAKKNTSYVITCNDAKKINLKNDSVDFIFTDFPYGDTVPYFEQSQIWNSWLKNKVDYDNEIVISDSKLRHKNSERFSKDIDKSISEIYRILKPDRYFTFTFHSLNGDEWNTISNSMQKHAFEFVDFKLLLQKTFTPRQLNRKLSIKGDLVVTYKKVKRKPTPLDYNSLKDIIANEIKANCVKNKKYETNDLIIIFVKCLLKYNQFSYNIDFTKMIKEYFNLSDSNTKWILKDNI